jgi:hypothetical protein
MKNFCRALSVGSCMAAFLAAAPLARALPIVNIDYLANQAVNPLPTTEPAIAPTGTFSAGLPPLSVFSFNFTGPSSETVSDFLTSGGDTITDTGGIGISNPINNALFAITGFIDLAPGTYTIDHNGAMYFSFVGSGLLIDSSDPTAGVSMSTFTITQDTGSVFATVLYAQSTTPEPSSFVLLGSGLLAAAGIVRRRRVTA